MKNLNNELWMVTIDNTYSYDNIEKRAVVFDDEGLAKDKFKEIVNSYKQDELRMAKDLFERDFVGLEDIVSHIDSIKERGESVPLASGEIISVDHSYGIEVKKDKLYALFTINRRHESIYGNLLNPELTEETVYVILRKINLGEDVIDYGIPCLDNVSEIEQILNTL